MGLADLFRPSKTWFDNRNNFAQQLDHKIDGVTGASASVQIGAGGKPISDPSHPGSLSNLSDAEAYFDKLAFDANAQKYDTILGQQSSPQFLSWTDGSGNPIGYGGVGASSAASVSQLPNYPNAPWASQYGMDQATAYQEALANSAHQREVADLRAAGLNPVLSATGGRGADSFGGAVAYPMSFGATSSTGGGSAGAAYYGSSGGYKGSSAKGLSSILNPKDRNFQSGVASLASAVVGGATHNFSLGAAAYYFTQSVLGSIFRR